MYMDRYVSKNPSSSSNCWAFLQGEPSRLATQCLRPNWAAGGTCALWVSKWTLQPFGLARHWWRPDMASRPTCPNNQNCQKAWIRWKNCEQLRLFMVHPPATDWSFPRRHQRTQPRKAHYPVQHINAAGSKQKKHPPKTNLLWSSVMASHMKPWWWWWWWWWWW